MFRKRKIKEIRKFLIWWGVNDLYTDDDLTGEMIKSLEGSYAYAGYKLGMSLAQMREDINGAARWLSDAISATIMSHDR